MKKRNIILFGSIATLTILITVIVFYNVLWPRLAHDVFIAFTPPNAQDYQLGQLLLSGDIEDNGVSYTYMELGHWSTPYDGEIRIEIRFNNDTVIDSTKVNLQWLRDNARSIHTFTDTHHSWPIGTESIKYSTMQVRAFGNEVLQIRLLKPDPELEIMLRTKRSNRWVSYPLSEPEAIELFGPADGIYSYVRH